MLARRRLLPALFACMLCAAASAEPVAPAVRAEIDALLARLAASSCSFNRNGSWHDAAEAKAHLLEKLAYLERRRLVQTTEQFIERAASGSSVSRKPYLVKCGDAAAVESRIWLTAELQAMRGARSDGDRTRRTRHAWAVTR
jgi:hypothetical protein